MNEIQRQEGQAPGDMAAVQAALGRTAELLQAMAEMIRTTNERMGELEKQVRMLERVTPAQATDLNKAIRERAAALCQEYRLGGGMETPISAAIRKTVRLNTGARSIREISRCDYRPVRELIETWDEYSVIKRLRLKKAG